MVYVKKVLSIKKYIPPEPKVKRIKKSQIFIVNKKAKKAKKKY